MYKLYSKDLRKLSQFCHILSFYPHCVWFCAILPPPLDWNWGQITLMPKNIVNFADCLLNYTLHAGPARNSVNMVLVTPTTWHHWNMPVTSSGVIGCCATFHRCQVIIYKFWQASGGSSQIQQCRMLYCTAEGCVLHFSHSTEVKVRVDQSTE